MQLYRMSNYELQGFRKLWSDRETDKQTGTTEIIYHAALRVVNNYVYIVDKQHSVL